ncbi:MAG: nitroreductase family protein [Gammaproteobacteria bacterium]
MEAEQDLFHIMTTARPMRRLKPDPVPQALLEEILDAACYAPNSLNSQPYKFLIVRDPKVKAYFGQQYDAAMTKRFTKFVPADDDNSSFARNFRTAMAFGKRMKDVPVLLFVCGERDWPMAISEADRVGLAPPSPASVYPCIQNILLGCRAKGLGSSLTTMHQVFEAELIEMLNIPETYGIVAVIPIGYPEGRFGPLSRKPSSEITYFDSWGKTAM